VTVIISDGRLDADDADDGVVETECLRRALLCVSWW
jgi:hypothetical protein